MKTDSNNYKAHGSQASNSTRSKTCPGHLQEENHWKEVDHWKQWTEGSPIHQHARINHSSSTRGGQTQPTQLMVWLALVTRGLSYRAPQDFFHTRRLLSRPRHVNDYLIQRNSESQTKWRDWGKCLKWKNKTKIATGENKQTNKQTKWKQDKQCA